MLYLELSFFFLIFILMCKHVGNDQVILLFFYFLFFVFFIFLAISLVFGLCERYWLNDGFWYWYIFFISSFMILIMLHFVFFQIYITYHDVLVSKLLLPIYSENINLFHCDGFVMKPNKQIFRVTLEIYILWILIATSIFLYS